MRKLTSLRVLSAALAALLALSACGGAPADAPTPPPEASPITAPTIAPALPTAAPEPADATAPPAEPTAAGVVDQPTAVPDQPTPTLEPLVSNTIPEDGQFDDELPFKTRANDPGVGPNSGDGIANVTFQFVGPDGNEVFSHAEERSLYCAFGGGDDGQNCDRWIFSEHNNQWPNGQPAQSGAHTLIVTIRGTRGGVKQDRRQIQLNLNEAAKEPTPTLEPLVSNSFPTGDIFGDELQFQTVANDPTVGGESGAGIDSVTFRILDSQGRKVYEHVEQNPLYCAFGGGDDLQNCTVWRFSEHNNEWPGGTPVENGGYYRLQVTVRAKSGRETSEELPFRIQL